MLGICFGLQVMAKFLGGKVERGLKREYGKGTLTVKDGRCALFGKLPKSLQVWNSHGDKLTKLPEGFKTVAVTENSPYAAVENGSANFSDCNFTPKWCTHPRAKPFSAISSKDLWLRPQVDHAQLH